MSQKKFIPNGDFDFVTMAESFAWAIAGDPARFAVSAEDAQALSAAVANFRVTLGAARGGMRSAAATMAKEEARKAAEAIVRRLAAVIRVNDKIDAASKVLLSMRERPAKAKQQPVPKEPPRLRFVRALHEGGAVPRHELEFRGFDLSSSKRPAGAVRLELFVDLIPPEEPIPSHPGANHGGRPWYLRSYSRSPIVVAPPMTRVPMRVVYWGRWADSTGEFGPFSATAVAWIEGGSSHFLPGGIGLAVPGRRNPAPLLEDATAPAGRDQTISVLVLEAQVQSFNPQMIAMREARQLEGPAVEEAA
jgi:hypothetical protein